MSGMRWCYYCKQYIGSNIFYEHIDYHKRLMNTDAIQREQYTGFREERKQEDYLICVLHQNKVPCPIKNCHCTPFGMIRKSYMLRCAKGIYDVKDTSKRCNPFFPEYNPETGKNMIPIDTETKTVIIMGVPIKLKI